MRNLARKCLARKKDFEAIADSLQPQWQRARQTSDSLKSDLRRIEEKLSEAIRRRDSLIARQMAAEAQQEMQRIAPAMTRVQSSFDKFARMERRIEDMEAEAAAMAELADISSDLGREVEQQTKNVRSGTRTGRAENAGRIQTIAVACFAVTPLDVRYHGSVKVKHGLVRVCF
jgi:phage shock protein A